MEYLKPSNLVHEGVLTSSPISARGKRVIIIGGGDTGADCLGTAHRQGAASVHQFEILAEPPEQPSRREPVATVALSCGPRRPTKRAGSASRSRRLSSSTTAPARARPFGGTRWRPCLRRVGPCSEGGGNRVRTGVRAGALGYGIRGHGTPGRGGQLSPELERRGPSRPTPGGRPTSRASSLRRPDPGAEPDRLGHRRRTSGGRRGGSLADGCQLVALADRAGTARPALRHHPGLR